MEKPTQKLHMATKTTNQGTLVLVRHGESLLNKVDVFTGWIDVPLSKKGISEAHAAAIHCQQFAYDAAFTSHLERAHQTLLIILSYQQRLGIFQHQKSHRYSHIKEVADNYVFAAFPIFLSEHLNERFYGDLQGVNKRVADLQFTAADVLKWRRGFKDKPPSGESLQDVYRRVVPYFKELIHPRIKQGETILIVAHGNTLRAIIKYIEQIGDTQIPFVDLPTGHPLVYVYANDQFKRIDGEYRLDRPLR